MFTLFFGGGRGGGGKKGSLRSVEFGTQNKGYQVEKSCNIFFNREPGTCSAAYLVCLRKQTDLATDKWRGLLRKCYKPCQKETSPRRVFT